MKKILVFFSFFIVFTTSFLFGTETLLVKVTGVGETVQLAIDNGVKQAIEVAVGALVRAYAEVDSQLKVTATDILEQTTFQERILSFSKAYIQNYVVLQTTQQWGLYYVELECAVRQTALEGAMLRNGIGFLSFEGSKLIALFEANRTTDRNAAAMIRAIFEDFEMPHGLWNVSETRADILSTSGQTVVARVTVSLSPDLEKYNGFVSELENLLEQAAQKRGTETVKFETVDHWQSALLSDFLSSAQYGAVLRIYTQTEKDAHLFREYFFNDSVEMGKQIIDLLLNLSQERSSYDLRLTLYDNLNRAIYRKDRIQVSQNSLLLSKNTFGFAYTGQRGHQFFLLPGSLRIEPGKVKFSLNPLTFSVDLEIPRAVFAESAKIVVEILRD